MVIQYRGHGLVALSLLIGYTAQCIWKSISGSMIRYNSFCNLVHLFIYSSSVANVWRLTDLSGEVEPLVSIILIISTDAHQYSSLQNVISTSYKNYFIFIGEKIGGKPSLINSFVLKSKFGFKFFSINSSIDSAIFITPIPPKSVI